MRTEKNYGLKELETEFGKLTFGRLLKSHRQAEELTQVQLAKLLGISKQSLNDLENGRSFPSIARSAEIARKIGLMESTLVELALQDQFRREKLNLRVSVQEGKSKRKSA
jgi:transcriptional regulator with XRE-family HTH domain